MARILLIDDDDLLRGVIAKTLTHAGHNVIQAADGRQGIDLFHTTPLDLIITDIIMPDMEGIEVILQLHQEQPTIPVIAISGGMANSPLYLKMASKLGALRTLAKPFTPAELLQVVTSLLPPLAPPA